MLHIGRIHRRSQFSREDAPAVVGAAGFVGTIGLGWKMAMEGLTFFPVIGWARRGVWKLHLEFRKYLVNDTVLNLAEI